MGLLAWGVPRLAATGGDPRQRETETCTVPQRQLGELLIAGKETAVLGF